MDDFEIPIIDLTSFLDGSDRTTVVRSVRAACEDIGFFVIVGHGFSDALLKSMYTVSRTFFDMPTEEKSHVHQTGELLGGLMFFPILAESLAASLGQKTPGDVKESLDYGPGFSGDTWPDSPPELCSTWMEYFAAMSMLSANIQRIFALGVGLDENFFEGKFDNHHSSLRVLNYPDQEAMPLPDQLRAGAHSDYGFLTILRTEEAPGGLQAQHRNGEWIDIPNVGDGFVVNIGDAMMRWTNDRWVSTVHRVVNPPADSGSSTRRQSMAFFHNPNKDAVIECLPAFHGPNDESKYPPIQYGEYTDLKYRQAHSED